MFNLSLINLTIYLLSSVKLSFPASVRNSGPILEVLKRFLNSTEPGLRLLDTASGSGMHAADYAPHFPNITFQPSDIDTSMLPSIQAYANDCPTKNICAPMLVDIAQPHTTWGRNSANTGPYLDGKSHVDFSELEDFFDYIININMIHISPIECTYGLFRSAGALLKLGGLLITYGPYNVDGTIRPQSNVDFDIMLRSRDARWGIRDLRELKSIAKESSVELQELIDMPANNKVCIWKKV